MDDTYQDGYRDAQRQPGVPADQARKLRAGSDYWQGWHDGRRAALVTLDRRTLSDPTSPGGWIFAESRG